MVNITLWVLFCTIESDPRRPESSHRTARSGAGCGDSSSRYSVVAQGRPAVKPIATSIPVGSSIGRSDCQGRMECGKILGP